jgi:hypothetical protein
MELLCNVGHIKSCFGQFGDSVSIGARWGHGLCQTYPRIGNRLGQSRCNYKAMWLLWSLVSVRFMTVSVSEQDWSTVCAKRTIGLEIILDASDSARR